MPDDYYLPGPSHIDFRSLSVDVPSGDGATSRSNSDHRTELSTQGISAPDFSRETAQTGGDNAILQRVAELLGRYFAFWKDKGELTVEELEAHHALHPRNDYGEFVIQWWVDLEPMEEVRVFCREETKCIKRWEWPEYNRSSEYEFEDLGLNIRGATVTTPLHSQDWMVLSILRPNSTEYDDTDYLINIIELKYVKEGDDRYVSIQFRFKKA